QIIIGTRRCATTRKDRAPVCGRANEIHIGHGSVNGTPEEVVIRTEDVIKADPAGSVEAEILSRSQEHEVDSVDSRGVSYLMKNPQTLHVVTSAWISESSKVAPGYGLVSVKLPFRNAPAGGAPTLPWYCLLLR